jgi:hypothetical protein
MGPLKLLFIWYRRCFLGLKRSGREVLHLLLLSKLYALMAPKGTTLLFAGANMNFTAGVLLQELIKTYLVSMCLCYEDVVT